MDLLEPQELERLIEIHLKGLERVRGSLTWNLALQITLIVLGINLCLEPDGTRLKVPGLGFMIDRNVLHVCIPVVLLAVWFHFGLTMHSCIDAH